MAKRRGRKKAGRRRYSRGAGTEVEREMRRYKRGTAKSGPWRRQGQEPQAGHRHRPLESPKKGPAGSTEAKRIAAHRGELFGVERVLS